MQSLQVNTSSSTYPIYFEESFLKLGEYLLSHGCSEKILVISDENVFGYYGQQVMEILEKSNLQAYSFVVSPGENSKCFDVAQEILGYCIDQKLSRKSTIIALGGGVIGDLSGFVASTFMRGIKFIQCPTTILSQSDSSVGGKVGINFKDQKNIVGAFYQPQFVYMALQSLHTLPQREFSAGMAEVIKHGLIYDAEFLNFLEQNETRIKELDINTLGQMIRRNCEIKADVVSQDEKELGLRAILNFGHTFGHAVESLMHFELLHGECVGIGMVMALDLSVRLGYISQQEKERGIALIKKFGLPYTVSGLTAEQIYKQMFYDKKTTYNKIQFVVLEKVGQALLVKDIHEKMIHDVIQTVVV